MDTLDLLEREAERKRKRRYDSPEKSRTRGRDSPECKRKKRWEDSSDGTRKRKRTEDDSGGNQMRQVRTNVADPRAEEPKLNCLLEREPKLRISVWEIFSAPQHS
jgi:hypothetical protein